MLQAELKMGGVNYVGIHNLSPGMVTTELLLSGAFQSEQSGAALLHAITSSTCAVTVESPLFALLRALSSATVKPLHAWFMRACSKAWLAWQQVHTLNR